MLQLLNNLTELMRTPGETEHCTAQDVGRNPTESQSEIRFSSFTMTPPCWNQRFRAFIKLPNYIYIQIYGLQNGDLLRQASANTHLESAAFIISLYTQL